MSGDLLLAIDNGTQSLRAMLFDPTGQLVALERAFFEPYVSPRPGWAEQDPEVFYGALREACGRLMARDEVDRRRIGAVALTTQRSTVINLDRDGRPLRPAIVWPDNRQSTDHKGVGGVYKVLFKILGLSQTAERLLADTEVNWITTHQPEIWEKTHKFLYLSGYLTFRLTGELADSVGCQVGYVPFDYKRHKWAAAWDWRRLSIPVALEQLPRLCPQGSEIGRITRRASEETGIPAGLPLIASATDKACEVLGAGALEPSVACLSFATSATVNVTSKKYVEPMFLVPPYPSAIPDTYTLEIQLYRGYWLVSWFKEQFGHPEREAAVARGVSPEALFDELIRDIPPGSMGLILQPYWTAGIKFPGVEAKGGIIGFGDVHTRAHFYKAILEGLSYALRHGKEQIERRTKVPIDRLLITGGGAQSPNAMQLTADIFGLPAERPLVQETSGLGAAINAACGLGLHPDYPAAIRAMTRVGDVFEPIEENRRLYDALYRKVFSRMYGRLKPLYERIREITGYPG